MNIFFDFLQCWSVTNCVILSIKQTQRSRIIAWTHKPSFKITHVSCVMWNFLRLTWQLSPVTNANSHSHRPSLPASFPIIDIRLVCKDTKTKLLFTTIFFQNYKNPKYSRGMPILAIRSLTRSLQSTGKRVFLNGTHSRLTDISRLGGAIKPGLGGRWWFSVIKNESQQCM